MNKFVALLVALVLVIGGFSFYKNATYTKCEETKVLWIHGSHCEKVHLFHSDS